MIYHVIQNLYDFLSFVELILSFLFVCLLF